MSPERKSKIEIRNTDIVTEIGEEEIKLLQAWSSVFRDVSMISKVTNVPAVKLDFSSDLDSVWGGNFFMKVKPQEQNEFFEPNSINTLLYLSPNGEGPRGILVELAYVRAEWENGEVNIRTLNTQKLDSDLPQVIFNELEMANAAKNVVMQGTSGLTGKFYPNSLRSDFIS